MERDKIEVGSTLSNQGCEIKTWGKIKWIMRYLQCIIN